MNKFLFKSSDPDLLKMLSTLDTIQKNILYLTYRLDSVLKKVTALGVDAGLQKQVDEYFEDPQPEDDKEPD